ncbi:MAG: hypothetical protein Q8O31_00735 [Rhodocyclaceae bacterium]|nr:hypothetical protein [Rhodocyclaceae bacterium]
MSETNTPKFWDDVAAQWIKETKHKRTHDEDCRKLIWIAKHWQGCRLVTIDRFKIQALGDIKLAQATESTVNRYLALIRAILRRAWREWEWLPKVPFIRFYPESRRRVRWLETAEVETLFNELHEHQKPPFVFALSTGLRHANVLGLRWDQIDLKTRVSMVRFRP